MEERIEIVVYKPKQGKAEALRHLMREHLPVLKQQNLVSDRVSIMMEAKDGDDHRSFRMAIPDRHGASSHQFCRYVFKKN